MLQISKTPWHVSDVYDPQGRIISADGYPVATVEQTAVKEEWDKLYPECEHWSRGEGTAYIERPDEEVQANLLLFAAAPDLLIAAIELRAAFLDGCGEATKGPKRNRLVRAAAALDKAIAKATIAPVVEKA